VFGQRAEVANGHGFVVACSRTLDQNERGILIQTRRPNICDHAGLVMRRTSWGLSCFARAFRRPRTGLSSFKGSRTPASRP
jgi:hypothetical protein